MQKTEIYFLLEIQSCSPIQNKILTNDEGDEEVTLCFFTKLLAATQPLMFQTNKQW